MQAFPVGIYDRKSRWKKFMQGWLCSKYSQDKHNIYFFYPYVRAEHGSLYAFNPKMEMNQPKSVGYEQYHTKFLVNWRSQSCKLFRNLMTNLDYHRLKIIINSKLSSQKNFAIFVYNANYFDHALKICFVYSAW